MGRPPLPAQFEQDVDNVLTENSEDEMEALDELAVQPKPQNVTQEMIETLRQDYFGSYKY